MIVLLAVSVILFRSDMSAILLEKAFKVLGDPTSAFAFYFPSLLYFFKSFILQSWFLLGTP